MVRSAGLVVLSLLAASSEPERRASPEARERWEWGGSALVVEPPSLAEVLSRMSAASRNLTTLRADLVQEKSYPQLGMADPPEKGTLLVKRARNRLRMRLDFEDEPRTLLIDGSRYLYYQPRLKQAFLGELENLPSGGGGGFLRHLLGDLSTEDEYRVELGEQCTAGTVHLKLVPVRAEDVFYQRVELFVDTERWLPLRQELVEANRDVTRIRLESPSFDLPLGDELFELDLPRDVERLRN
jgi:outer membrane lipoprotein-sorting protein